MELDALPPDVLQGLVRENIERFWDRSSFEDEEDVEAGERDRLTELIASV